MKFILSPEAAIDAFVKAKKDNHEVPKEVLKALNNYKNWRPDSLKGLLNASGYYPEILIEEDMEKKILILLDRFKKTTAPTALNY